MEGVRSVCTSLNVIEVFLGSSIIFYSKRWDPACAKCLHMKNKLHPPTTFHPHAYMYKHTVATHGSAAVRLKKAGRKKNL